ncbi:MAG: GatB/YqeY domain-containing protein, partial [Actinomycetales bacterium]|nr:GatB/YqeY domain-containing protein [Actinomycetales bacterium]
MSSLKSQLQTDLNNAMRAKDSVATSTLRMVITAITNEEVSGKEARELTDAEVITVINREAKKRKEAITAYLEANRPELAATEEAELTVIKHYLPEQLSDAELSNIINSAIS